MSRKLNFKMDTGFGWTWSTSFTENQALKIIAAPVGTTLSFRGKMKVYIGVNDITFSVMTQNTGTSFEDFPRDKVTDELRKLLA